MKLARNLAMSILLLCTTAAPATDIITKTVDGKQISCAQRSLETVEECGTESGQYVYVFIGSIAAVSPVPGREAEVRIVPEEIFLGTPSNPITVRASQTLCDPKITVGDRWLFYVFNGQYSFNAEYPSNLLELDGLAMRSRPVAEAQDDIRLLRLQQIAGGLAILRGDVGRGTGFGQPPVSDVQVHAVFKSNGVQTTVTTDANGHYEFPLLAAGDYEVSVDPTGSFRPESRPVSLRPGSCSKVTVPGFTRLDISGYVSYSKHSYSPVAGAHVLIVSADNTWFMTLDTKDDGSYYFNSVEPGDYVIGVNPPNAPPWDHTTMESKDTPIPTASLYYPNASSRSGAQVLTHATQDQKGINFVLPEP
ncbi:MAG: carboxypeptidase regulatory-like domain-containing protein [Acidobacteriaceae bacterium]